jgi:hypothetical protein
MSGAEEEPSYFPDLLREFKGSGAEDQKFMLRSLAESVENYYTVVQALIPDYSVGVQAEARKAYDRMRGQELAREWAESVNGSGSDDVYVVPMVEAADRIALGLVDRPAPSIGGLVYAGRVNLFYGSYTAGKTWLVLHLARLNAESGGRTLFVDYEDTEDGVAGRCLALDETLPKSIDYMGVPSGVRLNPQRLARLVEKEGYTLVIIDSLGEAMASVGLDSNLELDVTRWASEVPDVIAAAGPAVALLDHIAKKQDGTPTPVGSFRKGAAITGAMFALENKVGFSRERSGWTRITCTKDRNGFFATGEVVGRVTFTPGEPYDGSVMDVAIHRGEAVETEGVRDAFQGAILDFVREMWALQGTPDENGDEMETRPNITAIRAGVRERGMKGHNDKFAEAVEDLVRRGWLDRVTLATGPKTSRTVYEPRQAFDPIEDE